jgi:hypothetical protein
MGWGQDTPLDFVQTVALLVMTGVLIYAVAMVGRAIKSAVLVVIADNERLHKQMTAAWKKIAALEERLAAIEAKKPEK